MGYRRYGHRHRKRADLPVLHTRRLVRTGLRDRQPLRRQSGKQGTIAVPSVAAVTRGRQGKIATFTEGSVIGRRQAGGGEDGFFRKRHLPDLPAHFEHVERIAHDFAVDGCGEILYDAFATDLVFAVSFRQVHQHQIFAGVVHGAERAEG